MKRAIWIGLAGLLLVALIFAFYKTRPSGDIDDYVAYFVDDSATPAEGEVKVTFFGTSTLLFDDGETQVLIDGFFSRPSMLRTLTSEIASDTVLIDELIDKYQMHRVKGVFVTHSHYDHAFDVAYVTKATRAILYGSVSTLNIARGGGVSDGQLSLFEPYKALSLGAFTVQVIPSKHSPGNALNDAGIVIDKPLRQPADMKAYVEGGAFDFLIKRNGRSIYVKPSPNFIEGALDTLHSDALFLGIATVSKYTTAWQDQFYRENVETLKPSLLVPIHWDNFFDPMSEHLVMFPRFAADVPKDFDLFIERTKADHIDFRILQGTRSIILFKE